MHKNVIIWVIYFKIIWNSITLRLISGLLLSLEMLNKGFLGTLDVLGQGDLKQTYLSNSFLFYPISYSYDINAPIFWDQIKINLKEC